MGFWGIEVKPGKPYAYHSDNVEGKVHVTQATLGPGSSSEKAILQCSARDNSPVYLCSLLPNKTECCPLDLEFEEDDSVVFSVVGSRSIHLAGKFVADGGPSDEEIYNSDSYGEGIADTETDDSNEFSSDDEYGGDFTDDDDDEMFPPSPVPNSGVVIEEIVDDDKPTNENGQLKRPKKKNQSTDSVDKKNAEKEIVVKSGSGVPVLESEDEDGFPISSSHKSEVTAQKPEAESEQTEKRTSDKTRKKKAKDGEEHSASGKRKVENVDEDDQPESDVREKKKKKQQPKAEQDEEKAHESEDQPEEVKDQKLTNDNDIQAEDKKKKKKKKKKKNQESEGRASKEQTVSASGNKAVSAVPEEKKEKDQPSQARTYGNGLLVEEIAMGKPNGMRASGGSLVSVRYIGKLKKNGKIFDSNIGGPPFKFRLGVGAVIPGWDVGVEGMRVGDKRRLTIPPKMGYGIKGAGSKIPPNSWLVFDVELIDVVLPKKGS